MTDEEVKVLQDEVEMLKQEKESLNVELSTQAIMVSELEQTVADRDKRLGSLSDSLNQAVSEYKALVIQSNPEIIEEFISGDSIEQINGSIKKAKTILDKMRKGLEAEVSRARVPAGAPERTPPDLSVLSPREKIQYAIGGKR